MYATPKKIIRAFVAKKVRNPTQTREPPSKFDKSR